MAKRPTRSAVRIWPELRDRRLGLPQAVVRRLQGRSSERVHHGRRRRLVRRRPAPDLELLRGQADAPDHEPHGIDADGIGNHSFDHGERYLRNELIPLADFPMVSANVVYPDGTTPPEWSPSTVFSNTFDGGSSE